MPPPSPVRHASYNTDCNAGREPQDATFPIPFPSRLHFKPSPPVKSLYEVVCVKAYIQEDNGAVIFTNNHNRSRKVRGR